VDADGAWTTALEADGEVVWSWHLDAGVKSVEAILPMTETKKPELRGEHARSRQSHCVRECRVISVDLW